MSKTIPTFIPANAPCMQQKYFECAACKSFVKGRHFNHVDGLCRQCTHALHVPFPGEGTNGH